MSNADIDHRHIRRHVRGGVALIVALVLFTVVFGAAAVGSVRALVADTTATYVETVGEAVDDGMDVEMRGGRRSWRLVEFRTVEIHYEVDGRLGQADVASDTVEVGESMPIWVRDQDGSVTLEPPVRPDFWQWFWAVFWVLAAAALCWWLIVAVSRGIRLLAFRPDGPPDFDVAVHGIDVVYFGRKAQHRRVRMLGRITADAGSHGIGRAVELVADERVVPEYPPVPSVIEGYRIRSGASGDTVVVNSPAIGAWWVAAMSVAEEQPPG